MSKKIRGRLDYLITNKTHYKLNDLVTRGIWYLPNVEIRFRLPHAVIESQLKVALRKLKQ